MKTFFFTSCLAFILCLSTRAQIRIGGAVGYATGLNQFCAGTNGEFFVSDKISLAPSILGFFLQTSPRERNGVVEINFDGHYYVYTYDVFQFYGIGGLSYLVSNYDGDAGLKEENYTRSNLTLNLGGGVNFDLGKKAMPYSEIKVAFDNEVAVTIGLKIKLKE